MTDLTMGADYGGPLDHRAILYQGAFPDENLLPYEGHSLATVMQAWLEMGLEIRPQFFQRFPGVFATVKDRGVLSLAEVEQIRRFEHALKVGKPTHLRKSQKPSSGTGLRG